MRDDDESESLATLSFASTQTFSRLKLKFPFPSQDVRMHERVNNNNLMDVLREASTVEWGGGRLRRVQHFIDNDARTPASDQCDSSSKLAGQTTESLERASFHPAVFMRCEHWS